MRDAGGIRSANADISNDKGSVYSWTGQLGDGTTTQRLTPTLIGVDTWRKIGAVGGDHSLGVKF